MHVHCAGKSFVVKTVQTLLCSLAKLAGKQSAIFFPGQKCNTTHVYTALHTSSLLEQT